MKRNYHFLLPSIEFMLQFPLLFEETQLSSEKLCVTPEHQHHSITRLFYFCLNITHTHTNPEKKINKLTIKSK